MVFFRLPWQLSAALFAIVATSQIIPSNTSTAAWNSNGELWLQTSSGTNLSVLVPLTRDALIRNNAPLGGNLYNTNEKTAQGLSNEDIGYISCNTADYPGHVQALNILQEAVEQHNLTAVIFYSTNSDFCGYEAPNDNVNEFPIYSMTKMGDSQNMLNQVNNPPVSNKFFVQIARFGGSDIPDQWGGYNHSQPQNPLGPSPSTAVAMIILYSITGIITALFLVIIITGAVRAHRHPDRYGPRDIMGRPRQSRARGLGRAILDTIPIVKFGEREPPKPTDVEMGATSEARNVNEANTEAEAQNKERATKEGPNETEAQRDSIAEQQSGIAPAQPVATGAAAPQTSSPDEGLGCSICTEDFEKGQDIRVLPCDHKFHPECVDPWLLNVSGTCPLCRVDLRPTTSRTSAEEHDHDPDMLAPPLNPEAETSYRRRSALRDILSLRARPNASAEERISALRRLREQRHNQSGDVASPSENTSSEDVAAVRRSRRISARLSDVFSSRTRRHGQEDATTPAAPSAEASTIPPVHREDAAPPTTNNETDS